MYRLQVSLTPQGEIRVGVVVTANGSTRAG